MSIIIPTVVNEYLYSLKKGKKSGIAKFKVWGNCEKYKDRIEKALEADGIKYANWNIKSKDLKINYAPALFRLKQYMN